MGVGPATGTARFSAVVAAQRLPHTCWRMLTGRTRRGFVAGLIFGFNPHRVADGAPSTAGVVVPPALVALHEAVDTAKTRRRAAAAAIFGMCWLLRCCRTVSAFTFRPGGIVARLGYATPRRTHCWPLRRGGVDRSGATTSRCFELTATSMRSGVAPHHGEILGYSGDVLVLHPSSLAGVMPGARFPGGAAYPGVVAVLMVIVWVTLAAPGMPPETRADLWILLAVANVYGLGRYSP
jgi:hypothetical protein